MNVLEVLELVLKCAVLFVCGSACFDVVHYLLHKFEKSRFAFLRWLGGFHSVHHDFLDRQMQIQRKYSRPNILLHVIPEYLTAVVGVAVLGFLVFGWVPALIVIGIRTVMVIVYVWQKGEDFTHYSLNRIQGIRSLFFVGPHYHALHHVYPYQYYSSFVNIFDLVAGTNFQIAERRFLLLGEENSFAKVLTARLQGQGGEVRVVPVGQDMSADLSWADVLIFTAPVDVKLAQDIIEQLKSVGLNRLVPPEVWVQEGWLSRAQARRYYSDRDISYRHLVIPQSASTAARVDGALFLIRRGFRYVPVSYSLLSWGGYLRFLLHRPS